MVCVLRSASMFSCASFELCKGCCACVWGGTAGFSWATAEHTCLSLAHQLLLRGRTSSYLGSREHLPLYPLNCCVDANLLLPSVVPGLRSFTVPDPAFQLFLRLGHPFPSHQCSLHLPFPNLALVIIIRFLFAWLPPASFWVQPTI